MKKTLKDYFIVLFGSGIGRGIALANSVIIARWLGVESFGKFSLFYVLMIIVWQLPQAFDVAYVRYAKTTSCEVEKKDFLKVAVLLKLIYSTIMLSLACPLAGFLSIYCFKKPEINTLLFYSIISGAFMTFLFTIASIFQEKERFTKYAIINTFYTLSIFVVCISVIYFYKKLSLHIVIMMYLTVTVTIGFISLFFLYKHIGRILPLNLNKLNRSFMLGKWIFGVTTVNFIFHRLDVLILARYVDFREIGLYSVAVQFTMAMSLVTGSLNGISLPKASEAIMSRETLLHYIKESIIITTVINCLFVVFIIFAPFCLEILFGDKFLTASSILRIILIGWIFLVFYVPFSALFYAMEDSKTRFLIESSKILIGFLLLSLLIPWKGIMGAAIAMSLTLILNTCISLLVLKNKLYGSNLLVLRRMQ